MSGAELRIARLEKATDTGDDPMTAPIASRFRRWLAGLTPVEQWALGNKLSDPRQLEAEFEALPGGHLKADTDALEAWHTQRAKGWRKMFGDAEDMPSEDAAAAAADAALRRLPRGFPAWARTVGEEGLVEARWGRFSPEWGLWLRALFLAGLLFPESQLELVIRGRGRK